MTTERDELADLIWDLAIRHLGVATSSSKSMADELLAAGYRKPRTITTVEELDALPFETVIRDADRHVLERWGTTGELLWATMMVGKFIDRNDITLPATVLYTTEATL